MGNDPVMCMMSIYITGYQLIFTSILFGSFFSFLLMVMVRIPFALDALTSSSFASSGSWKLLEKAGRAISSVMKPSSLFFSTASDEIVRILFLH